MQKYDYSVEDLVRAFRTESEVFGLYVLGWVAFWLSFGMLLWISGMIIHMLSIGGIYDIDVQSFGPKYIEYFLVSLVPLWYMLSLYGTLKTPLKHQSLRALVMACGALYTFVACQQVYLYSEIVTQLYLKGLGL